LKQKTKTWVRAGFCEYSRIDRNGSNPKRSFQAGKERTRRGRFGKPKDKIALGSQQTVMGIAKLRSEVKKPHGTSHNYARNEKTVRNFSKITLGRNTLENAPPSRLDYLNYTSKALMKCDSFKRTLEASQKKAGNQLEASQKLVKGKLKAG
jgi:hypothetical protein